MSTLLFTLEQLVEALSKGAYVAVPTATPVSTPPDPQVTYVQKPESPPILGIMADRKQRRHAWGLCTCVTYPNSHRGGCYAATNGKFHGGTDKPAGWYRDIAPKGETPPMWIRSDTNGDWQELRAEWYAQLTRK